MVSLFLCMGTMVKAQTFPETSTAESPKYYTIKSYNRGGVLTSVGLGKGAQHIAATSGSLWYFTEANDNGGLYFCNMDGGFLSADRTVSETASVWYVLANGVNAEGLSISSTNPISNNSCVDANNSNTGIGSWHPQAGDWEGTTWVFAEVTDFSAIFNVDAAKTQAKAELDVLSTASSIYPDVTAAKAAIDAVVANSQGMEDLIAAVDAVNKCVSDYKTAAYGALAGKYYTIYTPARSNGYMEMGGAQVNGKAAAATPATVWQFVYTDGVLNIYNPYTEQYICEPGDVSANMAVTKDQGQAGAYDLAVTANPSDAAANVKLTSNGKSVHMSGGSVLVRWDNGAASEWTITEVTDFSEMVAAYKLSALTTLKGLAGFPLVFDADAVNAAKGAVNGVTATDWSAFAAIDAAAAVRPDKVLAFQTKATDNNRNGVWVSANTTAGKAVGADAKDGYAYWMLEPADASSFYIVNLLTGLYMGAPNANCPLTEEPTAAYSFEVVDATKNVVELKCNGQTLHASNHDDDKFLDYDYDADASRWMVSVVGDPTTLQKIAVTYNFTYGGEVVITQTANSLVGEAWPAISALPYCVSAVKPEGTIAAEDVTDGAVTKELPLTVELPFPMSDESTTRTVLISSYKNSSNNFYWRAVENGITAQKDAEPAENFYWAIYPTFADGALTFTIKNVATGKYIYSVSTENDHEAGLVTLADEGSALTFETNNKFKLATGKYLSLNSSGSADEQILGTHSEHGGTYNKFVAGEEIPVAPEVDPNDYTSAIANADLSVTDGWNTDDTKGISGGMVKVGSGSTFDFSQTITLPAGQYKMTAKAAYRYGADEKSEYEAIQAGGETHLVKLYAQTATYKYEADVQNRYEGASETNYAPEDETVSTVNNLFVPNSSNAVKAWFDADQYVNELVFNVQEDGEVKIGLANTGNNSNGEYTNIGAWTLTRIGDAEADPKTEEPGDEPNTGDNLNGTYYLYNVGAQKYLCSGWSWGSHAALNGAGVPVTLEGSDNVYTLSTAVIFADKFLAGDAWMDGGAFGWTFETVSEGVYKLKNGDNVLLWNGDGSIGVTVGADPETEAAQWMLVTEEARIADMAKATADSPVNATFLIKNADFAFGNGKWVGPGQDLTNSPSWKGTTVTDAWGHHVDSEESNYAVEQYNKQFDNYQELKDIPNGVYHLTAKGFYRGSVVPYIYANDEKCDLKVKGDIGGDNIANAGKALGGDEYLLDGVEVVVVDGTLRVGVKSDETMEWCVFDEFRLTYYGEASNEEALNAAKAAFTTAYNEFNVAFSACQAMMLKMSFYEVADAADQLNAQLDAATDVDALNAMVETLNEATASLNEVNEVYAEYDVFVQKFKAASEISMPTTQDAADLLEYYMYVGAGQATSVDALKQAIQTAKGDYLTYVAGAKLLDDNKFDLTYLIQNPDFATNMDGWATVKAQRNGSVGYDNVGGFAEIAEWGASSWEASIAQTLTGLPNGKYVVKMAWQAASGIKMALSANTDTVEVVGIGDNGGNIATDGSVVEMGLGNGGWQYAEVEGTVEDSTLVIAVNSSSDAQYQWSNADAFELYYLGVEKPAEPEALTVVGIMVGDVAVVDGVATVESISTIDITFDRPVALDKNAGWARITDPWGGATLAAEVLAENNCVVRLTADPYTDAYGYVLTIPAGFVVDAEDANLTSEEITATITIEGGSVDPATPLTVTSVTVGEDVMADFSAIVATPDDVIKVNFDGQFYYQGTPSIVDAEGNDASGYFTYTSATDAGLEGNSYIFQGQNWQGTVAPAGVYTITLAKTSFMVNEYMPSYKAPAEDIVLTVQVIVNENAIKNINADSNAVIYDIHGRRVEKMEKGIYIVNGKKVIVK